MLCSLHSNITINTLFPSPSPFNSQQLKRNNFEQAKPLLIAHNKEDGGFHYWLTTSHNQSKSKNEHHTPKKIHPQPNICLTMACGLCIQTSSTLFSHYHPPSTSNSQQLNRNNFEQAKNLPIGTTKKIVASITDHFTKPIEKARTNTTSPKTSTS